MERVRNFSLKKVVFERFGVFQILLDYFVLFCFLEMWCDFYHFFLFFLGCITAQYQEYVLRPKVSMTSGSGCFGLKRICRGGGGGVNFNDFERIFFLSLLFENCDITAQCQEYILRPEVFTTSRRGCFAMARTDRQTDRQTSQLYD